MAVVVDETGWNIAIRITGWSGESMDGPSHAHVNDPEPPPVIIHGRTARPVLCASCGYDLHNNPRGICPECGANREERELVPLRRQRKWLDAYFCAAGLGLLALLLVLPAVWALRVWQASTARKAILAAPNVQLLESHPLATRGFSGQQLTADVDQKWRFVIFIPEEECTKRAGEVSIVSGSIGLYWTFSLAGPNGLDALAGTPIRSITDLLTHSSTIIPALETPAMRRQARQSWPKGIMLVYEPIDRSTTASQAAE